jgi:hypothetical protein
LAGIVSNNPNSPSATLHWDGDDLLYVSDQAGNLQQLNIEKLAVYAAQSGLTVLDRDFSGVEISAHQVGATDVWTAASGAFRSGNPEKSTLVDGVYPGYNANSSFKTPATAVSLFREDTSLPTYRSKA